MSLARAGAVLLADADDVGPGARPLSTGLSAVGIAELLAGVLRVVAPEQNCGRSPIAVFDANIFVEDRIPSGKSASML